MDEPGSAIVRQRRRSSDIGPWKVVLWIFWIAAGAVLWVWLLDTSYDWISSASDLRVTMGCLILVSMAGALVALAAKGARWLWKR
jgi:hypothetical protein